MWKRVLVSSVVLAQLVIVPAVASAVAPEVVRDEVTLTQTSNICGFPLDFTFELRFIERTFFDKDGNPTRFQFLTADFATVVNPANGKTVSGHEVQNIQFNFRLGTAQATGVNTHFNAPGGTVLIDVGRDSINFNTGETRLVGKHQLTEGDIAEFCAALA